MLDRHRHAVGQPQPLPVGNGGALLDLERAGDTGAGALAAGQQGPGLRLLAAPLHLLGVRREPHLHVDQRLGDEGASTGHPLEQPLRDQGVDGVPHGHPGDAELLGQVTFGGCRSAGFGTDDHRSDVLADQHVLAPAPASASRRVLVHQ